MLPTERTFACAKCGAAATTILLVPTGVPPRSLDATRIADTLVSLPAGSTESPFMIIDGIVGQTQFRLEESSFETVKRALEHEDSAALHALDSEYVSSFCPNCGCHYCRTHWTQEVAFDDGYYDCTYGVCPAGHKCMLDD
jgi:predicted RNA-binding Zn-ribbon protein involved in translation (DUF1610 family)